MNKSFRFMILFCIALFCYQCNSSEQKIISLALKNEKHGDYWDWGSTVLALTERGTKTLFSSSEFVFWENKMKLSPKQNFVAIIAQKKGKFIDERGAVHKQFLLLIIDSNGHEFFRLDSVILAEWSPDGDKLGFVSGVSYNEAYVPTTNQLRILDVHNRKQITLGSTTATRIAWAEFDNNIYLDEKGQILQINSDTKRKVLTKYHDMNFSSDGRYYYVRSLEPEHFKIYERMTGNDVTPSLGGLSTTNFAKWLPSSPLLIVGDITFKKNIIEVETKRVKGTVEGKIIGFKKESSELIVHKSTTAFKNLGTSSTQSVRVEIPRLQR